MFALTSVLVDSFIESQKLTSECSICITDYNEEFKCEHCSFKSCIDCQQRYMSDIDNKFACMSCKLPVNPKQFPREFRLANEKSIKKAALAEDRKHFLKTRKQIALREKSEEISSRKFTFVKVQKKLLSELSIDKFKLCSCNGIAYDNGTIWECTCDANELSELSEDLGDCKRCPSCDVPIYKFDGCYQVMCTECNCIFDYNKGEIDNGQVHAYGAVTLFYKYERDITGTYLTFNRLIQGHNYHYDMLEYISGRIHKSILRDFHFHKVNEDNRNDYLSGHLKYSIYEKRCIANYKFCLNAIAMGPKLVKAKHEIGFLKDISVKSINEIYNRHTDIEGPYQHA
jgi:hypothetical protein